MAWLLVPVTSPVAQTLSLLYSSLAHHNDTKLLREATLPNRTADQDIIRAKIDCTFDFTIDRVDILSRTITVKNFKASHVGVTAVLIVNVDLLDGPLM